MEQRGNIIVLSGIPCSGKSTLAEKAKKLLGYHIISRDQIREDIFGKKYVFSNKNEELVSKTSDFWFNEYVKNGYNIILDNTHCKEKYLNECLRNKPENYDIEFVFVYVPLWKAHYRNIIRWMFSGKYIPFNVINNMKKNFDKINKEKYETN